MRKLVGEIGTDGGDLGHDRIAVLKSRHLTHGIDGEILWLALVLLGEREQDQIVGLAEFFEHPSDH